jgi:hypothetical protein
MLIKICLNIGFLGFLITVVGSWIELERGKYIFNYEDSSSTKRSAIKLKVFMFALKSQIDISLIDFLCGYTSLAKSNFCQKRLHLRVFVQHLV